MNNLNFIFNSIYTSIKKNEIFSNKFNNVQILLWKLQNIVEKLK
jgi:hypothetical protein